MAERRTDFRAEPEIMGTKIETDFETEGEIDVGTEDEEIDVGTEAEEIDVGTEAEEIDVGTEAEAGVGTEPEIDVDITTEIDLDIATEAEELDVVTDAGTEEVMAEPANAEPANAATASAPDQLLSPGQAANYRRYVKEAKEATKNGNLEAALKLFYLAKEVFPNDKVLSRIQRLEEALAELSMEGDDEFIDVCNSGLMLYRELHDQLFEHQKEGVAFLYSLYKEKRKGGILADDMGLGKTVQIIAFLSAMFDAELVRYVLLIMPTSLISTWTKEFGKWAPGMRVATFHGSSKSERTRNLNRIQRKNGVAVTTYQMVINNWQQLSQLDGKEFVWDYLILDEAHKIKSSSTKSSIAARAIPVKNRVLLTGTPVQNNLYELWSLFDFACQGSLLGTFKTFKIEYENPITRAREKDATSGEKALGLKISENLMTLIKPYFLRRTKDDVKKKNNTKAQSDLPEKNLGDDFVCEMPSLSRKNELIIWVYLVPLQEEIYRKFVSLNHIKQLLMETRSPLAELTILKKLCDHPRLLSARACSLLGLKEGTFFGEDGNQEAQSDIQIDQVPHESLMKESGKVIFLMALLKRLKDEGHQTLVFSQSRKLLDIIEHLLKKENFKTLRIDGTVTHLPERQRRIDLFQQSQGASVFLLTSQVGGVGLTLTAASRVVIFDPSWNPATDAQAVDRVYRIGQKENVVVYRLITCGTVEEKIYRRQVFKDSLIRQTTGDQKNPVRYFSKQELRELFTIGDFRSSPTQMQLHSLHAGHRKTDKKLEEHIAYLHTLGIAGISDHDLMFTHDLSVQEESEAGESQYIQERVQKAQLLVELESQNNKLLLNNGRNRLEENWLKGPASSKPKKNGSDLNASHSLSPPILVDLTQNDSFSSEMATLSIVESSESADDLSAMNLDVSVKESDANMSGTKTDHELVTIFSNEECLEMGTSKASNSDDSVQILSDDNQESKKQLADETKTVDLEPNPDQSAKSEILLPFSPEKSIESDTPLFCLVDSGSNEDKLEEEPLDSSLQYSGDFNLFLEDSVLSEQNHSKPSLAPSEKEKSVLEFMPIPKGLGSFKYPQFERLSDQESELEDNIVPVKTKRKTRRIVSDDDDSMTEGMLPSIPNSLVTQFSSTPINSVSQSELFLSEIGSGENNPSVSKRSLASRRSLINVILDHVEDLEEEASEQKSTDKHLKVEMEEYSQDSEHSEEESAGKDSLSQSMFRSNLVQSASDEGPQATTAQDPSASDEGPQATTAHDPSASDEGPQATTAHDPSASDEGPQATTAHDPSASGEGPQATTARDPSASEEGPQATTARDPSASEEGPQATTARDPSASEEGPQATTARDPSASEEGPQATTARDPSASDEGPQATTARDPSASEEGPQATTARDPSASDEGPQATTARDPVSLAPVTDEYEALVRRGKELKENGKIQEALNCFLKALDIKSTDPQVMLLTLNLYKQLNQT
ncbi:DNA excision repair protein ERCC-6-like [Sminthopsis crassicaudata]|uniref:DNA excision repair protein ERCC-6-like n=1 Tax=Sminthopsis crassicaudata TaxID=9301 RepID=UPI003D69DC8D